MDDDILKRLIKLETISAYQDQVIDDLNKIVLELAAENEKLQREWQRLLASIEQQSNE